MKTGKYYKFSELSKKVQQKAIDNYCNQHGCFSEKRETIIEHFESWDYLFYKNGKIY
jgi:flavorubredoxin